MLPPGAALTMSDPAGICPPFMDAPRTLRSGDGAYPGLLVGIPDPPRELRVRGDLRPELRRVAIVGTRAPDEYGEQLGELAESQFVFVDKGKADGVEEGNSFTVIRSGDPRMNGDLLHPEHWEGDPLPIEDVGRLLVVDVKDHTSAALVTRSLRELLPGDRVEMRVAEK